MQLPRSYKGCSSRAASFNIKMAESSCQQEVLCSKITLQGHRTLEMPYEEDSSGPSHEEMVDHNSAIRGCKQRRAWHLFVGVVFGLFIGVVLTFTVLHRGESPPNTGPCSTNSSMTNNTHTAHPVTAAQSSDLEKSYEETIEELEEMACRIPRLMPVNMENWINEHHHHLGNVHPKTVAVRRCDVDCQYCEGKDKRCQVKSGDEYSRKVVKTVFFKSVFRQIEVTEHVECECGDGGDGKHVADSIELLQ